jgi:putative heme-binding domain-containing protein
MMTMLIETAFVLCLLQEPEKLRTVEEFGLRIAPGFRISLVADHTLANDIYAMTLDAKGRIVVTSAGWIKVLEGGKASLFATTRTGGMGMCFDGNDLLFSGDGGFWRYRDADGDGKADGPPENLGRFISGEHGHHAMRKGPDGCWYLIGGNDTGFGKLHVTLPDSPIKHPLMGAILRFTPDLKKSEVVAHGFRNPYDFDFNSRGEIFTYDSDCERDYFLPWYTPTRIFRVGHAQHHGWRLTGYLRSFANRDYFPDAVDIRWAPGRGSPTGVTCYRHTAFPERYHDGVFALDWTFGKVFFLPRGSGKGEVFLEPTGTEGFAPTDIAVAPDGALILSIGGRRTRGAVFRIEAEKPLAAPKLDGIREILAAPQPLDAWSRARWEPPARELGSDAFERATFNRELPTAERIRAIEIMTEMFEGLSRQRLTSLAGEGGPEVRARIAWSIGRSPIEGFSDLLQKLAGDESANVRQAALEAMIDRFSFLDLKAAKAACEINLGHPVKSVRQAAGRLFALLPEIEWPKEAPALLTALIARRVTVDDVLRVLQMPDTAPLRRDAMRALVLAMGDTDLRERGVDALSNYSVAAPPDEATRAKILAVVRPMFPAGDELTNLEISRVLAMLQDDSAETLSRAAAFLTETSSATSDIHYLIVLARLRAAWPEGMAARLSRAILSLGTKLGWNDQRVKQTWGTRVAEVAALYAKSDPRFVDEMLRDPLLVHPGHVPIAAALKGPRWTDLARRFLEAVKKDGSFAWSEPLISLLSQLPREEFHPVLRAQWSNFGMRDSIVMHLSTAPDAQDREKYLTGVESANGQVALASLKALQELPVDATPKNLVPLLRLLRRLQLEPKQGDQRKLVAGLIGRQSGKAFETAESATEPAALKKVYQPVFDAFESLKAELEAGGAVDVAALLKPVPWDQGDEARGQEVFRARGCQTCHAVQGALGPALAGAASRFSREDLFEAIANPSRDVAPLYRTTMFQMKDGNIYTGIVAFESADGYILQTGATTTVRINTPDVAARRPGALSLMPNGLVDGLKPADLADLYAYLRSLK